MPNHDPPGLRPSQAFSAPGPIVDWHGIIQVLWDKSWLIISCVVLALAAAAAYVKWTPRVYEAVATVQVEQEDPKVVKTEQVVSGDLHELDDLNTVSEKIAQRRFVAAGAGGKSFAAARRDRPDK